MERPLIFISHASVDAAAARRLREWLISRTANVVDYFLSCDRSSLRPGEIWAEAIAHALDRACMVLILTTSASERSAWVAFEAGYATGQRKPVIPILPPSYDITRLKPPLNLRHALPVKSASDLGALIERLNGELHTSFTTGTSTADVDLLFSDIHEHWWLESIPLMSRENMYAEIAKRVSRAELHEHIRVTSTLPHRVNEPDPSFQTYIAAVAAKCAEAKKHDDLARYTVVMAYTLNADRTPPPDRVDAIRYRQKAFADVDAGDRITILQLDDHWMMDVMTIGHENSLIAFPIRRNDPKLRHAMWITGHAFVSRINEWFEEWVRPKCRVVDPVTLVAADAIGDGVELPRRQSP